MTEPSTTQRDDLARELFIADNSNQPREASLVDWEWFESTSKQRGQIEHYKHMAAGMIAAGYRKPRTITTVEELDALPEGSVVLDGDVCVRRADGYWKVLDLVGVYASRDISLPATVLHEPEAEAAEFGIDECNGSGRCDVSKHVHGCYSDLGRCDEPAEHEATR